MREGLLTQNVKKSSYLKNHFLNDQINKRKNFDAILYVWHHCAINFIDGFY